MIKTICKLFYRMDMFYLIINKKTTFYLKRWALGGGLAYISIYVFTLHICSIHYIYYVYAFFCIYYTYHTLYILYIQCLRFRLQPNQSFYGTNSPSN